MKGKRMVSLEEGQEISEAEYEDLYGHARNSGIWYATNLPKTTHELKRKLYEKGYPEGPVYVRRDGGIEEVNIVDSAVASLVDALFVDDLLIAERYAETRRAARYGPSKVARDLRFRGIEDEDVEATIAEVYEGESPLPELVELVERTLAQELKSSDDLWRLRRRVLQKAVTRGWDMGEAGAVLEELLDQ